MESPDIIQVDYLLPEFRELYDVVGRTQIRNWQLEFHMMRTKKTPEAKILKWYNDIIRTYGPRMLGYRQCTELYNLFKMQPNSIPSSGTVTDCSLDGCIK